MAYLTSFKSSMPSQHWWPSKRKRRVGVSSFYWGATSRNTLSAGTFSPVWKELCVEKTLTKEIFKSSLFERLRKAVNNAHFIVAGVNESKSSSSTSHLLEQQQDRLSDWMDDLFDQTAKDSRLFFLACVSMCLQWQITLQKARQALSKSRQNLIRWQEPTRWITPDFLPLQHLRVRLGDLYNQRHRYSMVSISVILVSLKCQSSSKNYYYRLSLYCYLFFT